ncbi:YHS domain-containing (seleno)protein [Albidovulum sediminis]|uniref:YHS domain-containing protein n=1 Tax=Albidovulum sediminis TaxID=3066345 RepID=A0ABT2NN40_9RHOB|nr:YHS domain-containing (seleno)protein [Defluviimonas sediminis]MCT8328984.1 hypothetical protein [Defluviimonas sediminis]
MTTTLIRKLAIGTALALTLATSALAGGFDTNMSSTGLALEGVDPVSYFVDGTPKDGDFQITSVHDGAVYRFVSEENKAKFEAEPAKYLPQYGGYCAMGAAMGMKLDGDPELWKIVDGKLYLNVAPAIAEKWQADAPNMIVQADAKWAEIKDKSPAELMQ